MSGEFSVYQFFPDGQYEKYLEFVTIERAAEGARFLTTNVASSIGITRRVIITDGGDCICWEWKFGEGITFPPECAPN